ncbi:MAG: phosphoethanolamine--lipid A transferase [Deltaproteobacteria bacterium]|jgi:lipid A ethanolaminephosphotransferase|nr:phosphoethanolamine--lipid A transferase [Deltaproteobacteria bacterium]
MLLRLKKLFSPRLTSFQLIVIASLYFLVILNISFWRFIWEKIPLNSLTDVLFALSTPLTLFLGLGVIFLLTLWPIIHKAFLAFLIFAASLANYAMVQYKIFIDSSMMRNVFETNRQEALDYLNPSLFYWIALTGLIPVVLILRANVKFNPWGKELKNRALGLLIALLALTFLGTGFYKEWAVFGRNNKLMTRLINPTNYLWATYRYFSIFQTDPQPFKILDPNVSLAKVNPHRPPVFVLILGETARSKNFSLNGYAKETNPELKNADIISFSDVTASGTSTAEALPAMFSPNERSDYRQKEALNEDNLVDLLARAGYDVLWLDNDGGCKKVCDRVKAKVIAPDFDPKYCDGQSCYDGVLIDLLAQTLTTVKGPTLIVLHSIGSHGPSYHKRYPPAFKVFSPTCDSSAIQNCPTKEIVNTYDNSILYTDHIINQAINVLKDRPDLETGLLYVSDHGESLGENGLYLHGLPYSFAPEEQLKVPMILWLSHELKTSSYLNFDCLKARAHNPLSHDHLFHSLAGLLGLNTKLYAKQWDLFLPCQNATYLEAQDKTKKTVKPLVGGLNSPQEGSRKNL